VTKYNTTLILAMSFVVAVSLISATAYAQQDTNKTGMDKGHKYFAIQETKSSVPDNIAPGHAQYHQIAVALPYHEGKLYAGQLSYTASKPVNVFITQPLNTTITQNATSVPLANIEGGFAVGGSNILEDEIADNVDFAGSAVYFHSRSSEPFTIAYTAVGKVVEPKPLPTK
jgi:hypothetical protein